MLRPGAKVEPVAYFVEAERIGQRLAVAKRSSRVVGLKRLVENPSADEDSKDSVILRDAYQHREDDYMDESFEELAVIHRANAGDKAQNGGG